MNPSLKITYEIEGRPTAVVTVPPACLAATDAKANELGYADAVHFLNEYLLNNVLVGVILPSVQHTDEVKAELARIAQEVAVKTAELESKRLAPLLPTLTIGGVEITLPQIRAQVAAAKAAHAEKP